jgi:hypothetical protein
VARREVAHKEHVREVDRHETEEDKVHALVVVGPELEEVEQPACRDGFSNAQLKRQLQLLQQLPQQGQQGWEVYLRGGCDVGRR